MLRRIVKSIVPATLLKHAFVTYNALRIRTIDRFLFPEYVVKPERFLTYRQSNPFLDNQVTTSGLSVFVQKCMSYWLNWSQEEYILEFTDRCIIEPEQGWAIHGRHHLIYYSLGISRTPFLKKPNIVKMFRTKKVIEVDQIVSLRDTGEENYFHFFNDVLTKLCLLRSYGFDLAKLPVLLSKRLADKKYFQFFLEKHPMLKGITFVIQDDEYVRCSKAIFCKALTHRTDYYNIIFSPFATTSRHNGRIYVKRGQSRLRRISNDKEVEAVFTSFGFAIHDCDDLSVPQQIQIFSSAKYIAGVHGAGMTNIAFRSRPAYVLEIFPYPEVEYLPFHYIMISQMNGLFYDAIVGDKGREFASSFTLNIDMLKAKLRIWTD